MTANEPETADIISFFIYDKQIKLLDIYFKMNATNNETMGTLL